jgi:hypothetical protein
VKFLDYPYDPVQMGISLLTVRIRKYIHNSTKLYSDAGLITNVYDAVTTAKCNQWLILK